MASSSSTSPHPKRLKLGSSSSHPKRFKYEVFLSFRGEDTRKGFLDHLHHVLQQLNIFTFKDDKALKKGERIGTELIKAIEDSQLHVIVFSKTYASSAWCLDELAKIMACQIETTGHTVFPVFYDVEPTDIRQQSRTVGELATTKGRTNEDACKWEMALVDVAGIAGHVLNNTANGHEAEFIQQIVKEISQKLYSTRFFVDANLVGMESRMEKVISSLELESGFDKARMIGIKGMGGIGKTTLARAIFNQVSHQFEGKSFVGNVREVSLTSLSGLKSLQEQIISNVSGSTITVNDVHGGKTWMKKVLSSRKILVVLDDVDHLKQLEALAGKDWYGAGSIVIITTRDERVLQAHKIVDLIHEVDGLSDSEAIRLFCRYAFGKDDPNQGYEQLTQQATDYASGLPLTIKVLGSSLYGDAELQWRDAIERLKQYPEKETLKILELSYNGLDDDLKEIFLDVACIMNGGWKEKVIRVLESCGFQADRCLKLLHQKSLIIDKVVHQWDRVYVHDLLAEMAMDTVRRRHREEPCKHSRLWKWEEIEDILAKGMGTKETRCIARFKSNLDPELIMKGLGKMETLRFLDVVFGNLVERSESNWKFDEASPYLPNALRYLCLDQYPFETLPESFQPTNLVALELTSHTIVRLWERGEEKLLKNLKFFKIKYTKLKTVDLSLAQNLKTLEVEDCLDLVNLHMPVRCPNLKELVLSHSGTVLRTLNLTECLKLETLELRKCDALESLQMPNGCQKLKTISLVGSKLTTLDLTLAVNLEDLTLEDCDDLQELHMPVGNLKLVYIFLHLPNLITTLDRMPDRCPSLKKLVLRNFRTVFRTLDLTECLELEILELNDCDALESLQMPNGCQKLNTVCIDKLKLTTLDLMLAVNLESLTLAFCYDLQELNMPVGNLKLVKIFLHLPNLITTLNFMPVRCPNLKSLVVCQTVLRTLNLTECLELETLELENCDALESLQMRNGCPKLKTVSIDGSKLTTLDLMLAVNLENLTLTHCDYLQELHMPVGNPKLAHLWLHLPNLITTFDLMPVRCPNLEESDIRVSGLRTLNLAECLELETLELTHCDALESLQMPNGCPKLRTVIMVGSKLRTLDLTFAVNLERLTLEHCDDLQELHMSVENLKLVFLSLSLPNLITTLDLRQFSNLVNPSRGEYFQMQDVVSSL